MIDSGATGIFMDPKFAKRAGIRLERKDEPFQLQNFDGSPVESNGGILDQQTGRIPLRMGRHQEMVQFDVTTTPGSDVVLGLPWLQGANPTIN